MAEYTINEKGDIEGSLLDDDGSARDINFEDITWAGVDGVLELLAAKFGEGSVTDFGGNEIASPYPDRLRQIVHSGGIAILENGVGPIPWLRVFVFPEKDGSPFLELTFFPSDIQATGDLRADFIAYTKLTADRSGAARIFVRYESAAWRFADSKKGSGVFLVLERDSDAAHS